ncbi:hypothetical protein MKW98_010571 [Papaver atlanticum]|uniref:MIP18 family-like domain-containing protein n=1 Tax=Papaver atlanticum TaxID=357466 RepID=A0AAD4S3L4_9MAGN|nr:hypothetical protein MKW98_010571 [Papaver atlanticum]
MVQGLTNANPVAYEGKKRHPVVPADFDEYTTDPINQLELFNILLFLLSVMKSFSIFLLVLHHIRDIRDPELPNSLEELKVVTEDAVEVDDKNSHVRVTFTPTNINCEMAKTIGLCLRIKLMRSLPSRYNVDIRVAPGTHAHEAAVNKRVNDKERVGGALELPGLVKMVYHCLAPTYE